MANQTNARSVSRPLQGHRDLPRKLPKWNPTAEAAPPVVSQGSVSRPTKRPLPRLKTEAKDRPGTIVQR